MSKAKIAIIIGTTRANRFGDKPARWLLDLAATVEKAEFEIVDLRDYPLPFFEEARSPAREEPKSEIARRWGRKVAEFDAYVFVTAEYNHGISGVLKNALDYAYAEFNRKPAAFVGYGGVGGARAVEQLRLIAVELQLAPLKNAVHISMVEIIGVLQQNKALADYPHLAQSARLLLDDLLWWTEALKRARERQA